MTPPSELILPTPSPDLRAAFAEYLDDTTQALRGHLARVAPLLRDITKLQGAADLVPSLTRLEAVLGEWKDLAETARVAGATPTPADAQALIAAGWRPATPEPPEKAG